MPLSTIHRWLTFDGSSYRTPFIAFAGGAPRRGLPSQRPYIDVANRFADVGPTAPPAIASGRSWVQLAGSLARPNSPIGQTIDGFAELLTAEICEATGGVPGEVCGAAAVRDYEERLPPATP